MEFRFDEPFSLGLNLHSFTIWILQNIYSYLTHYYCDVHSLARNWFVREAQFCFVAQRGEKAYTT